MLKNILIKSLEFLNQNESIKELKNADSIEKISTPQIQNDIIKLISFYNYTVGTLFHDYLDLTYNENLVSDSENKIFYHNFSFQPIKITLVTNQEHKPVCVKVFAGYVLTNSSNTTYNITYKYLPDEINNFTDKLNIPKHLAKIVCMGMVSEFLASKNLFNESDYWKNKFMFELFKFKTQKERRLKPLFKLWNKM